MFGMDYGTWRGFYTVLVFVLFIAVIWWAYSKKRKQNFDDAANSIFEEDDASLNSNKQESKNNE